MVEQKENLDLIWGVGPIGREIGRTYQQTYHMIQAGHLPPVRQVGQRYVASRKALIEFFTKEAAA
ncbi:hypothetical protein B5M44_20775 [Shinella sumterensis]|uniref:hypothetical protein n=1 Tax=Shinella sumterensis TaxID=1967501 RepID=UPI00106EE34F|nr:hypothetical protein [Shinella sumterensis]MCD1265514.1 hypothetical protein [Shinella sumterensis]TFE95804.1 hypothetical protein B5M44_20775 [Shinella sumterensis]